MKIIVVGAGGTLGRAVVEALGSRHEVLRAGRGGADLQVDITRLDSVRAMYERAGPVDAVVCAAGSVPFAPLQAFTAEQYLAGLQNKVMGQVHLVLEGRERLRDGGSFTLISGVLAHDPVRAGSSASMVNGAIDAFVAAAAIELPRGLRINAVSPTVFVESMEGYGPYFRGFKPVPVAEAGLAFAKSVEGAQTGKVYRVG